MTTTGIHFLSFIAECFNQKERDKKERNQEANHNNLLDLQDGVDWKSSEFACGPIRSFAKRSCQIMILNKFSLIFYFIVFFYFILFLAFIFLWWLFGFPQSIPIGAAGSDVLLLRWRRGRSGCPRHTWVSASFHQGFTSFFLPSFPKADSSRYGIASQSFIRAYRISFHLSFLFDFIMSFLLPIEKAMDRKIAREDEFSDSDDEDGRRDARNHNE